MYFSVKIQTFQVFHKLKFLNFIALESARKFKWDSYRFDSLMNHLVNHYRKRARKFKHKILSGNITGFNYDDKH